MKKVLIPALFLLFGIGQLVGQNLTAITYNIRLDVASDGENAWMYRKDKVCGLLAFYEPDVIGVQEAVPSQMSYIDSSLTAYNFVGVGRDGGNIGEYSAIFYKTNRFEVLEQSTFWLSETPDTVSFGWDAACRRICTYSLFKDKESGKKFWVFNLHLDHVGQEARINGVKLVVHKIKDLNSDNLPVILLGDFNATLESEPIQLVSQEFVDSREASGLVYGSNGTFNGFKFHEPASECIDYIFTSRKGFKVLKYAVLTDSYNCHYPSDHFPVLVKLGWE
ncbi:MAG: endonuclease/exonuclease/phosphatase family protein [Salinivirgaceae bacterium]